MTLKLLGCLSTGKLLLLGPGGLRRPPPCFSVTPPSLMCAWNNSLLFLSSYWRVCIISQDSFNHLHGEPALILMSFSACVSEAPSPDVFSFFISFCHGSSTSSQLCKETTNTGFKELFRTFETIRMDMVAQIMKVGVGGSCRRDLLKCKWGQVNQTCIQVGVSKYFIKHRDYSSRFPRLSFMLHLLLLRDRLQLFHGPTLRC